ncbi:MAG: hypothetical protein JW770_01110 [Actinobacteria bacterium]|nr:hypothetical protein [Actinomycetota bacterium]
MPLNHQASVDRLSGYNPDSYKEPKGRVPRTLVHGYLLRAITIEAPAPAGGDSTVAQAITVII